MKKIISLYGQPGCGKSTQVEMLAKRFGFVHFGMGERLRAEIDSGSQLGQEIKPYVDEGLLIPDALMAQIIKDLGEKAGDNSLIFDGFPRIMSQANMLAKIAQELGFEIGDFFYLRLTPEESLRRIAGRAKTVKRGDDVSPEAIKNRFAIFEKESKPLLEFYRAQGKLHEIDGSLSIEETHQAVSSVILR